MQNLHLYLLPQNVQFYFKWRYGLLRTENSAIFEGTEFSQSAHYVSAGKLCAQGTNQANNFEKISAKSKWPKM